MEKRYEIHTEITKELLDSVKVGDLVKCNDWKIPYRVKGVSENYFVMARRMFGQVAYSICEKKPWRGIRHNAMTGGMFHIGPDNWVFGWDSYDFDDQENMARYLESLEKGETCISGRRGCPLTSMAVKRS